MNAPDVAWLATETDGDAGRQALAGVDEMLAARPGKDDAAIIETVQRLCILRDQLIAVQAHPGHSGQDTRRLSHANAVIAVVLAVQFPLGETPWPELAEARIWLEDLVVGR